MEKWLHVLRVRCEQVAQSDMFALDRKQADVIIDALRDHPSAEIGGGSEWHVAASEGFDESAVFFQLGRVQSVKTPQYDDKKERFYEADGERAPYVNAVFDGGTQACVIERKPNVSAKASEVATKLEKLLNSSKYPTEAGFRIVVDELRDPEGFIEQIRNAERVTRFQFTAEFENAHDVQNLIHRPAERYNELIGGDKTTVETRGPDLDKEVVEEMARSAASLGDPASATIHENGKAKGKNVYLRGTPLLEKIETEDGGEPLRANMLEALRRAYRRLREPNDD